MSANRTVYAHSEISNACSNQTLRSHATAPPLKLVDQPLWPSKVSGCSSPRHTLLLMGNISRSIRCSSCAISPPLALGPRLQLRTLLRRSRSEFAELIIDRTAVNWPQYTCATQNIQPKWVSRHARARPSRRRIRKTHLPRPRSNSRAPERLLRPHRCQLLQSTSCSVQYHSRYPLPSAQRPHHHSSLPTTTPCSSLPLPPSLRVPPQPHPRIPCARCERRQDARDAPPHTRPRGHSQHPRPASRTFNKLHLGLEKEEGGAVGPRVPSAEGRAPRSPPRGVRKRGRGSWAICRALSWWVGRSCEAATILKRRCR